MVSAGELAARVLDWAGLVLGSVDGLSVGVHRDQLGAWVCGGRPGVQVHLGEPELESVLMELCPGSL